jgi:predicted small lipoprotein YifL
MIKNSKNIIAALVVSLLLVGISGCKKEGPMERAGKSIDKTVEKGGDQIEKAGKKIQDGATGK